MKGREERIFVIAPIELLKIRVVSSFRSFMKDIRTFKFTFNLTEISDCWYFKKRTVLYGRIQFSPSRYILSTRVDYIQLHSFTFDSNRIYLISLSPDILDEVSQAVMKLYLLITWLRNSGLIQDYRIFEDMHHGIT